MLARIRSIWLAGGGALALTVMLSGIVAAATVLTVVVAPAPAAPVVDTTATFEDLDGNGIDDDCQVAVSADPVAAASAEVAADLNGDGTISVTEAAQSGRAGGKNCNHGGYVSVIATASGNLAEAEADTETKAKDETLAECVAPVVATSVAPVVAVELDPASNAHGKAVSEVAQSDAVGGKNCNHGGAVSAAAKKDHEAAKAARDASKAARDAAREARKAARDAAKASRTHGKPAG
jgi:hypothetical protein